MSLWSYYDLKPKGNPSIMAAGWPNQLSWHQTMHGTNKSSSWLYFAVRDKMGHCTILTPFGEREKTPLYFRKKEYVLKY